MPLNLDKYLVVNKEMMQEPNLCNRFTKDDHAKIGLQIHQGYERDQNSREKWMRRMDAAMDLAMQIQKAKTFPWPGASNVVFPLLTIAALQFSARSYGNIIQGNDVVKYRVVGGTDQIMQDKADRISKHMSWQVLEQDMGWEEQHDRMLINLALVGSNFIKTYYSPKKRHNVSELVMARDFVLDYYAKSVEDCARKTQIVPYYRNEIYERVKSDVFLNILDNGWYTSGPVATPVDSKVDNRQGKVQPQVDDDTPFTFLEQHCLLDLDGDGYAEPYIATVELQSKSLVRLIARWDDEVAVQRKGEKKDGAIVTIDATEYYTKYSFIPAPDGGIYDMGFGLLLGPINESVNTAINQLFDAGTISTTAGGFLGRGAKIRGGTISMAPWEWKRVDSTGDDLRKSLVPLPVREPSNVLFSLLSLLIQYSDRISGTTEQMVGENPGQNTPAETSRNTTEQGMKIYTMIFKRVWRSMKEEFKKLHLLNRQFLPATTRFGQGDSKIHRDDYSSSPDQVVPVADPNLTTNAERFNQAVAVKSAAATTPGYDPDVVEKNYLRALRVDNVEAVYPGIKKIPPGPSEKITLEQMKIKGRQLDHIHKKQMLAIQLMADRRKVTAEIIKMQAETSAILATTNTEQAQVKMEMLQKTMDILTAHTELLDKQIELMRKDDGQPGDDESSGANVPGMEEQPDNAESDGSAEAVGGGDQGSVGDGSVPGG